MQLPKGEGCVPAMGGPEVTPKHLQTSLEVTKQHGKRPLVSSGSTCRLETSFVENKVVKRSLNRAFRRAQCFGMAWYRGRCYTVRELQQMGCKEPPVSHPIPDDWQDFQRCNQHHSPKRRLVTWQWNSGGLSNARLDEVKAWLVLHQVDVATIQETRWRFDGTWQDPHWHILHSGAGSHLGKGILILISKRVCSANNLKWQFYDSGRLVHVRLNTNTRPIDIISCYQHTFQHSAACATARERWWTLLDQVLHSLPHRNNLILLGDFNCSLTESTCAVGCSTFTWDHKQITGPRHKDQSRLLQILRHHDLIVLNAGTAALGPTFVNLGAASRIDYICVRRMFADAEARQTQYLWHSPFLAQPYSGHVPILCSVARYWIPSFAQPIFQRITMQQRINSRQAYLAQTPAWRKFADASEATVQRSLTVTADNADPIEQMHADVLTQFCHHFPAGKAVVPLTPWQQSLPTLTNKWEHRRCFLKPAAFTLPNIFRAWYHVTRFTHLKRLHKRQARAIREMHFQDVVKAAKLAADKHDTFKLLHIINAYAPKQQRRQIQLRNADGHMASPVECIAMLNQFVSDTWHGPRHSDLSFDCAPGVPFSLDQLIAALEAIPVSRAVAKPFAPGPVWRQHAQTLGPLLFAQLQHWWSCSPPYIPQIWRNGWLVLIPKPGKIPSCPQQLRPLALQEPIGKAVVGLLIRLAVRQALPHIVLWPVWAYLENRSTQEGIRRVADHCMLVRNLLGTMRSTPHSRATARPRSPLYGGLQVCLDLQRAFDCINRTALFARLHCLHIDASIIQLLCAWHVDTQYIVQHDGTDTPIETGRGVRQGCKGAPGLWTFFLILMLHDLTAHVPIAWIQSHMNIYADDIHVGSEFTSLFEFEQLRMTIGIILHTLKTLDLTLNPNKSVAILKLQGSMSRKVLSKYVSRTRTGSCLKIDLPTAQSVIIPIHQQTKYLGIIISYDNFEDASLRHRLTLMRVGFQRMQRWLTGRHCLSIGRRLQLWQTCIYPILSYGIFATGLTKSGIALAITHMTKQLRHILHDHPYLTRRNNQQTFLHHQVQNPAAFLHGTVTSLLESIAQRHAILQPQDLALTVNWTHLTALQQQLAILQAADPSGHLHPARSQPPQAGNMIWCQLCGFQTADVSHFRRHCTIIHGLKLFRTTHAIASDFTVNGLPECRFCGKIFTTWRTFQHHIERGCQAIVSGPLQCTRLTTRATSVTTLTAGDMSSDAAALRKTSLLTQTDLALLQSLDFGPQLLRIVHIKDWTKVQTLPEACKYLKERCVLCAHHFSRIQDLQTHLRKDHAEYWPHVQLKAQQLTNLYSQDPPCGVCGTLFRTHTCPVWTQTALLAVNGAGMETPDQDQPLHHKCEICGECFDSVAGLTQHLQGQHGLHGLSFNPSRDALDGCPACNHCGMTFSTMGSLKTHIVQGKCLYFNPMISAETKAVEDKWQAACLEGQLFTVLASAHNRLRLTLHCQQCGKVHVRSADLALHLQSAHTKLWQQAQRLTLILVEAFYSRNECCCNPSVGIKRGSHICVPLRQLAMCFHRLDKVPFAPMTITEELLTQILTPRLPRAHRFLLEQLLTNRQFIALWQEEGVLAILRHQCIFCGARHQFAARDFSMQHVHTDLQSALESQT